MYSIIIQFSRFIDEQIISKHWIISEDNFEVISKKITKTAKYPLFIYYSDVYLNICTCTYVKIYFMRQGQNLLVFRFS